MDNPSANLQRYEISFQKLAKRSASPVWPIVFHPLIMGWWENETKSGFDIYIYIYAIS